MNNAIFLRDDKKLPQGIFLSADFRIEKFYSKNFD